MKHGFRAAAATMSTAIYASAMLAFTPGIAAAGSTGGQDGTAATTSETAADTLAFSANASLLSDYRFRGTSYSMGEPVTQVTLVGAHESGLYGGVFASSLGNHPLYGTAEVDLFAGFAKPITPTITADVTLVYYLYPDANQRQCPEGGKGIGCHRMACASDRTAADL